MQVGDSIDQHEDFDDDDSLFGSPPPSPGRGRSSSPLALPGGQNSVHNVGTLALPGSHLCSELPSALPPAPSINTCDVARLRSQPPRSVSQAPPPRSATVPPSPVVPPLRSGPVTQKRKRPSRRCTPAAERRPSPPPIQLPSPTDPPPANFLRNQQALLGHAGLISGVHPANLALQRHLRGKTPHNPIVVEEEEERPSIGQRPLPNLTSLGRLPVPSSHDILSNLVKQKNLVPVVNALVRLVAGSTLSSPTPPQPAFASSSNYPAPPPSTASSSNVPSQPPYVYPYQPYSYAYPYYYHYPYGYTYPYAASAYQQPAAPYTTGGAPPPKRRRLSDVPAGASDWDVPYPFPEGQGPPGYHQNWQHLRGQQLVEDLVGLVKSAAKKAAVQKAQAGASSSTGGHAIGSVEYYRERVLRHYRPHTRYDVRPTLHPVPTSAVPPMASLTPDPIPTPTPSLHDTPIHHVEPGFTPPEPSIPFTSSVGSAIPERVDPGNTPDTAPMSSLGSPQTIEATALPAAPPETDREVPNHPDASHGNILGPLSPETGENIDDLLSIFNDLPAGELDALLDSTDFSTVIPDDFDFSSLFDLGSAPQGPADAQSGQSGDALIPEAQPAEPTNSNIDRNLDVATSDSMFAIDPELLSLSDTTPPPSTTTAGPNDAPVPPARPEVQTTNASTSFMGSGAPPTPTLVGSPSSQVDFDPPTPSWDFSFLEPEIAGAGPETTPRARAGSEGVIDLDGAGGGTPKGKDKGKGRAVEGEMEAHVEDTPIIIDPPPNVVLAPPALTEAPSRAPSSGAPSVQAHTPCPPTHSPSPAPFNALEVLEPLRKTLEALLPQPSRVSSLLVAPPAVAPPKPNQVKDRDEILRRARLMREQLAAEIERAKIELWETAMEGGCLAVLGKERDKLIAQRK